MNGVDREHHIIERAGVANHLENETMRIIAERVPEEII